LGRWPRFKEECMGSRSLLPLLLLPIRPMCARSIARKKAQSEASETCHHVKAFFFC